MAKVNWSMQSFENLAEINDFLSLNSEKYADFVVSSILEVTTQLEQFPHSGRVVPETRINTIREIIILKFRIIYQLEKDESVNIITIRHSSKPLSSF